MPHAYSTFSIPRAISPSASVCTLPCSAVMTDASSLRLPSRRSRSRNNTSARPDSDAARHAGKAACAAATAASSSSLDAKSTSAACSPVAGLYTTPVRPEVPTTDRPSIQWLMRFMVYLLRWRSRAGDRARRPCIDLRDGDRPMFVLRLACCEPDHESGAPVLAADLRRATPLHGADERNPSVDVALLVTLDEEIRQWSRVGSSRIEHERTVHVHIVRRRQPTGAESFDPLVIAVHRSTAVVDHC